MKYKDIEEVRNYKYGSQEKLANLEEAREYVNKVRNEVITELSLEGYYKAVKEISQIEGENSIALKIVMKYPVEILERPNE